MARQPVKVPYQDRATVQLLESDMQYQEIGYKAIIGPIAVEGRETKAVHDRRTPVPPQSLELKEDPNGNVAGSAGSTRICQGEAMIGGVKKKVAAFRKGSAAAAPPPPAPPPPGPPPPPPPVPPPPPPPPPSG